jgi:GntR family transcriptional regulator, carbon starvation induced regulator
VSATPLREALQRLAAQSLVELGPRLGATVAGTSDGELREIYALRTVLEPMALERSILLGTEAWEREVTSARDAFVRSAAETPRGPDGHPDAEQILSWSGVHRRFHDALFEACDSAWLLRFVGILSHHSERYRLLSHRHARRHPLEEHEEIYRAVITRDVPRAVDALRRHLSRTVATLHDAVDDATYAADGRHGNDAGEALAR